ncbi:MAG: glycosyltransferase family 4 protein [Verrucomicrobiia bacterium]
MAKRLNIVDKPGVRKVHKKPMPLLGGVAVVLAMWLPVVLLCFYDNFVVKAFKARIWDVIIIFFCSMIMFVVGLIDDIKGLNARQKFAVQVPVALILVISGIQFGSITIPGIGGVKLGYLGPIITFIWVVGVCNAINIIDGLDGLAAGVVMFASLTNAIVAIINGNVMVGVLMISLAGACLGFLRYNFYPAKIFLGDAGSLFLGMTLAVTSILGAQKGTMAASLLIPAIILGYPVIDTLLSMIRRFLKGKSMFSGDRRHIHHRLVELLADQRKAVFIIYIGSIIFSGLAIMIVMENNFGVAIGFLLIGILLFVCLKSLGYADTLQRMLSENERYEFKAVEHLGRAVFYRVLGANNLKEIADQFEFICKNYSAPGYLFEMNGQGNDNFKNNWFLNTTVESDAKNGVLHSDSFEFEDTGAHIVFYHNGENDDLEIEKRNMLSEIAKAANERVKEIYNGNKNGNGKNL